VENWFIVLTFDHEKKIPSLSFVEYSPSEKGGELDYSFNV